MPQESKNLIEFLNLPTYTAAEAVAAYEDWKSHYKDIMEWEEYKKEILL
jgi:hypothetical protein